LIFDIIPGFKKYRKIQTLLAVKPRRGIIYEK